MDNYLSSRWPKGPGVQPPPVPGLTAPPAPRKKTRGAVRRWAAPIVCVVLVLALLGGISFWAVNGLAGLLANADVSDVGKTDPPHHSWSIPERGQDWSPDDLPWGEPDPSVQLRVEPAAGAALSGREIHRRVLPGIVYIEAQEKGALGRSIFSGTGILATASGYVLTNYHIIEDSDRIKVMPLSHVGAYYSARVIGVDEEFDLAVLKFDGSGLELTPARLGDSDALAVGDKVYAEGNPMGRLLGTMTEGIVSALDRDEDDTGMGMIQTSAALNPGNSGGALVNEYGQVVGITSAKITGLVRDSGDSVEDAAVIENIGLAIPMSDILPFVNRILATGSSWRPAIGISCSEAELDGRRGVRVAEVNEGAPALEAGLREGDLIISANGAQVTDLAGLRRQIYRTGVDGLLHCVVVRDGEELAISFALIEKTQ